MSKRIIVKNLDDSISVIIPSSNSGLSIEEIAKKDVPLGASYKIVDVSEIPSDRSYRNAWKLEANNIVHDMDKAKEIHKEKLRDLREPKLKALDIEYQKADEVEDKLKKKEIADKKKVLRDITKIESIDAALTIEELKLAGLSELE